jgi:hypothetical protein
LAEAAFGASAFFQVVVFCLLVKGCGLIWLDESGVGGNRRSMGRSNKERVPASMRLIAMELAP